MDEKTHFTVNDIFKVKIPVISKVLALNSLYAFAVGNIFNIKNEDIIDTISKLKQFKGRGEISVINFNNKTIQIINDSYNASPEATKVAIENAYLLKKNQSYNYKRLIFILGDMLELGELSTELHNELAEVINISNVDIVLTVGEYMKNMSKNLNKSIIVENFDNVNNLIQSINSIIANMDILLIKGSKGTKLDLLIDHLNYQY